LKSAPIGKNAVVIGAGVAGLTAARVLADYFDNVVILETDALPGMAHRPGTPQARHMHTLLAGGLHALATLFPAFEQTLQDAGAIPIRISSDYWLELPGYDPFPQRDLGIHVYSMTRPLIEAVIRRKVALLGNVEFYEGCKALRFLLGAGGTSVNGVLFINITGTIQKIPADFVIDATGHGLLTLNLLGFCGMAQPPETRLEVNVRYSTAVFEIPEKASSNWKWVRTPSSSLQRRRSGVLSPIENNQWIVTMSGRHGDSPEGDRTGYFQFAQSLGTQTIFNAIRHAKSCGDITQYAFKGSYRRYFEKLVEFPRGLLPFGDVICRSNPVFGQGMSIAAQEARLLHRLLAAASTTGKGMEAVVSTFLVEAQSLIDDASWSSDIKKDILGPLAARRPLMQKGISDTLFKIAHDDPAFHKLLIEVIHLLKPNSVLREPENAERVRALMAMD
jgi:2-polyprenyl-6-methoxyphenol hydroxylase-like FAD-dependent oxidoreductase